MTDADVKRLETKIDAIARHLGIGANVVGGKPTTAAAGGEVATDAELDGQYGDPEIKKDPTRWQGESFVGRRYSETSPEYLDMVASLEDWRAGKDDEAGQRGEMNNRGKPKDGYFARKNAARARGWAKRLRAGWGGAAPKAKKPGYGGYGEEEPLPFLPNRLGGDGSSPSHALRYGRLHPSTQRHGASAWPTRGGFWRKESGDGQQGNGAGMAAVVLLQRRLWPRRRRRAAGHEGAVQARNREGTAGRLRGDGVMIGHLAENMQARTTSKARNHAPLTNAKRNDEVERANAFLAAKGPTTPPPDARAVVARRIATGRGRR